MEDRPMAKRCGTPNYALREARARGDTFYQPDFLCNNGHMTKRLTSSGACYECHKASTSANNKKTRNGPNGDTFRAKKRAELARWVARPENAEKIVKYRRQDQQRFPNRKKYPENGRADYARIRAKKLGCEGSYTGQELKDLMVAQGGKCLECSAVLDEKYEADHKIPLRVGGTNYIENIQLLCGPCNRAKGSLGSSDWEFVKAKMRNLAKL
jgi:5-methylcytosine-specific restriction endonuclease McrA